MNFPVFDLHCDTLGALAGIDKKDPVHLRENKCHIDLNRASNLPGYAQCFAIFTTPYMENWHHVSPVTVFERDLDAFQREMALNCGTMVQAYTAQDVRDHQAKGLMSAILTIEGPAGFGFDPALLEDLYKAGFRITTLGWNEKNPLTGSHETGGGLTDLGREYVKEAQRLGMLVDVSHISDEGFWDILKITNGPVIASHSNSRAVCGHSRNLTDDMFRAICETGGVTGFNQCAPFVGKKPTLDTACDHFLHFLELDPSGTHIALGGDLDGCNEMPEGFEGVQSYPSLANRLLVRGVDENTLHGIFWDNALNVLERAGN